MLVCTLNYCWSSWIWVGGSVLRIERCVVLFDGGCYNRNLLPRAVMLPDTGWLKSLCAPDDYSTSGAQRRFDHPLFHLLGDSVHVRLMFCLCICQMTSVQITKSRIRSWSQIRGTRFLLRFHKTFSFWSHTCISAYDRNSSCAVPYAREHLHVPIPYYSRNLKMWRWFIPIDPSYVCFLLCLLLRHNNPDGI
jgi:hypothetical protein